MSANQKQEWVEEYARRIGCQYEQWQKPLGIDTQEYLKYLTEELAECYEQPLRKSLVELIC